MYSKAAEKAGWNETLLESLVGGINTQDRPELLAQTQIWDGLNVKVDRGALKKDSGYKRFAVGGSQDTLDTIPQAVYQFYKKNGTSELVCITLGSVYTYSTSKKEWQYVKGDAGTTLTANAALGATSLQVASSTGFSVGNKVGITLDSGYQYRTTVSNVPDPTHIEIPAAGLPSAAASGKAVIKAVHLSGSASYAVSVDTLASNDWMVFSNNVDSVKRYNGTDCVTIPGLPSAGDCKCIALTVYNSALFLLGTTEGGTAYPQRVRRSEIADGTTWSGGTAGYDDLLDSADYIVGGDVLGPYLIVYKERTIYRGQYVNTGGKYYDFPAVVQGEGLAAYQGIIDMGDSHIFLGNANVYEYRGDFTVEPLADNIFYNIFSFDSNINTANKLRSFAFFVEELDEAWFFITTGSSQYPDIMYRYNFGEKSWLKRAFQNQFVGYGFYQSDSTLRWQDGVGTWAQQVGTWNSRAVRSQSPTTLLCAGQIELVYEYDYVTSPDGDTNAPSALIETRDFSNPDGPIRTDCLEVFGRGSGITITYSTDLGVTWNTWETVSKSTLQKIRSYKQIVADTIRFRLTCADANFTVRWVQLIWRLESDY